MSRLEELFERQRDRSLEEAETAELVRMLDDPAERRAWSRLSNMEGALREALSTARTTSSGPRPNIGGPARARASASASRPWVWAVASVVVLVAVLAGVRLIVADVLPTDGSTVATVLETDGAEALDGGAHALVVGDHLRPGARVRGACTLSLPDGSRLFLAAGGELAVAPGPGAAAHLMTGDVTVEAAKRPPGSPLAITTPHAEVSVLGTRFTIDVTPARSSVSVDHGRVRVVAAGSSPVDVGPGEYAEAATGIPTWHWQPPTAAWRIDLAGHAADLVKDGWEGTSLPDGLGAVPMAPIPNGVAMFAVGTPVHQPEPGLVRFRPDLALALLISLDRPATLLVQLQIGTPGPHQTWLGNYQTEISMQPCTREALVIPWADFATTPTAAAKESLGEASIHRVLIMEAVSESGLVIHRMSLTQPAAP